MTQKTPDSRLSAESYRRLIEGVVTQFDIIRFSLKKLSDNQQNEFLKKRVAEEVKAAGMAFINLQNLAGTGLEEAGITREEFERVGRATALRKYGRKEERVRLEMSEERLNQSELLLLVAHFESFMKLVHRRFLEANPSKVFGTRTNVKVQLNEVFDPDFTRQLIEKEVKRLDSERMKVRVEYFKEHFGIDMGSGPQVKTLLEFMELRNKISHEIYSEPPRDLNEGKVQPLVGNDLLNQARKILTAIPSHCVEVGAKKYQSFFRWP